MSPKSGAEAELKLQYPDEETARVVAEAVSPDNYQAPEGLELKIDRINNEITVNVRCPKGVGSLITTLDDLLSCIGAAEKVLDGLR
ncbi:MAG: KEOPS complex subunit Pcc1 [Candidatus Bathyarchaeia archaeon]